MFNIYIRDFNQNGNIVSEETLIQTLPSEHDGNGELKFISPIVKVEMGNAESLDFSIEPGTPFYDAFRQMKTFIRVTYDGTTIFYGRILTISDGFWGTRKVRCEGPLAFFNDTAVEGIKEESRVKIDACTYLAKLIDNHNTMCDDDNRSFKLGEVPGNYSGSTSSEQRIANASRKFGQDSWTDTKSAIEDLRSHYGGYLRIRYEDDGLYLDWMNHYFYKYNENDHPQTVEVGKNILDISTSTEIDNIFTVVIPIGNSKSTSYETEDGTKKSTGAKHFYVPGREVTVPSILSTKYASDLNSGYHTSNDYAQAINKYGRIIKTVVFDDAENSDQLLDKCYEWIKNNYQGEVTKFTIKALDMHQIGDTDQRKILVGDQVKIYYPVFKEDGTSVKQSVIYTCLSISYDLYNPENNSYTFGIPANILTKSYGLTKQSKSVTQASTTPKSGSSGGGSEKESDWLTKVINWLSEHQICYRHAPTMSADKKKLIINESSVRRTVPMPWNEGRTDYETGPFVGSFLDRRKNRFIDTEQAVGAELASGYVMWKCVPVGNAATFSQTEYDKIATDIRRGAGNMSEADIQYAIRYAQKAYKDTHSSNQDYECYRINIEGTPSVQAIHSCHIIDYVKQEYGIDLGNFQNSLMPETSYTDEEGNTVVVEAKDGYIVVKEMFNEGYVPDEEDEKHKFHIVLTDDNRRVASIVDEEGNWTYYEVADDGTITESHIRTLSLVPQSSANFIGSIVTQDENTLNPLFLDEKGTPHEYKMGQGIEKWRDGEMVTATVDGDVVRIGSKITQYATTVATRINGSFISPMEYIVDPDTGKQSAILVGKAGQASYEAYYDKKAGSYLPVPYDIYHKKYGESDADYQTRKDEWLAENGPLTTLSGDGVWDTDNLAIKGGIYTVMENGKPVTYVASKQLIVGDQNTSLTLRRALVRAGLFQKNVPNGDGTYTAVTITDENDPEFENILDGAVVAQKLVANEVYAAKIRAIDGEFDRIKTDYLNATWISNMVASLGSVNVRSITGVSSYTVGESTVSNTPTITMHTYTSTGNKYYVTIAAGQQGQSTTYRNIVDGVYALKIFGPDATTKNYTLKAYSYTDNPAADTAGTATSGGTVVGTFRSYTGGWDAARASVMGQTYTVKVDGSDVTQSYFPDTKPTTVIDSIRVGYPNATVDGSISPIIYVLGDYAAKGNDWCALHATTSSGQVVAAFKHGKYSAGWDYAIGTSATDGHPKIEITAPTVLTPGERAVYKVIGYTSNNTPVEYVNQDLQVPITTVTHNPKVIKKIYKGQNSSDLNGTGYVNMMDGDGDDGQINIDYRHEYYLLETECNGTKQYTGLHVNNRSYDSVSWSIAESPKIQDGKPGSSYTNVGTVGATSNSHYIYFKIKANGKTQGFYVYCR